MVSQDADEGTSVPHDAESPKMSLNKDNNDVENESEIVVYGDATNGEEAMDKTEVSEGAVSASEALKNVIEGPKDSALTAGSGSELPSVVDNAYPEKAVTTSASGDESELKEGKLDSNAADNEISEATVNPSESSISDGLTKTQRIEDVVNLLKAAVSFNEELDTSVNELFTEDHENEMINWATTQTSQVICFYLTEKVAAIKKEDTMYGELGDEEVGSEYSDSASATTHTSKSRLVVSTHLPGSTVSELCYAIREEGTELSPINFKDAVQFGAIRGNCMETLLRLMSVIYAPVFLSNSVWPESVKKEFSGQLHKFMAYLTDATHQMRGHTVLYVPNESIIDVETAARDKDLVQRLETALIHWTRQVKEVLSNQDTSETAENAGPLEEIEFWRSRCSDLSGITDQLNKPGVKHIQAVLEASKSSYLGPFLKLSKLIEDGSQQAHSNLTFLSMLTEPCEQLSESEPKEISPILPHLLNCIRVIWCNSQFFNSKERLTGLLRKVSNEIINRCCHKISLDEIFDGNVHSAMVSLQESIECGEGWKKIYSTKSSFLARKQDRVWNLDQSSIFAQIDAFVQRCRDLLEVCEGQIQFARKSPEGKTHMPSFGGSRGLEIAKSLLEIEAAFEKNLGNLRLIKSMILDVKATRWHDDYSRFKQGIKDLEVMMQNIINSAFESITTVESGVQLLSVFHNLAKRDMIKRAVDKKTIYVFTLFNEELNVVKKTFDVKKKNPDLMVIHPRFAGAAHWAKALKLRIDRNMQLLNKATFIAPCVAAEEARKHYQQLTNALEEYMVKTYNEWVATIDSTLLKRLEATLMCRSAVGDLLECKFDKSLLRLFSEVHYWEKLRYDIPYSAMEIYCKKEELRVLREHVLLVVRDYNNIMSVLSSEERSLFRERIRFLDRKVNPGINKLNWDSKGITDYFVRDCRVHCQNAQTVVNNFKLANKSIALNCKKIADTLLVKIQTKRVYADTEFQEQQAHHRETSREHLAATHAQIVNTMSITYEVFRNDGYEVQTQWQRYTQKVNRMVEDALRLTVKRSLQELSRSINGDGKTTLSPLFKVNVVLERQKVIFSPSLKALDDMVNTVASELIQVISCIPHLTEALNEGSNASTAAVAAAAGVPSKDPISTVIGSEEDTKKILNLIKTGMNGNAMLLQTYLSNWDKYKDIWDINKDAFMRRYAKRNPQLSHFDGNISRYGELTNNVQKEDTITNISFLLLDCSPLKLSLVGHCNAWQKKFTTLLNELAVAELTSLSNMLDKNSERLRVKPSNLEQLGNSLFLLHQLQEDLPTTEGRFSPLTEKYVILEKYEVPVEPSELVTLKNMQEKWIVLKQCMQEADTMLAEYKEKFKSELLTSLEEFNKSVASTREEFLNRGPFDSSFAYERAMAYLRTFRERLSDMFIKEGSLRNSLDIFSIEQPPYKDISSTEKELDMLEAIWQLSKEWDDCWNEWKVGKFDSLDTAQMEDKANKFLKRVVRLSRDLKDWEVCQNLRDRIMQFKRTMPLVQDLKNPALRQRHWDQLIAQVGVSFDHSSDDFTLENIVAIGLDQYVEYISQQSSAASKELAIEGAIDSITQSWSSLDLDIVPYKESGHYRLRSAEDVFATLEDNQVTLSTMKASRFVRAFETQVDYWERTLSQIMETVEMILTVQRQWMYLENIFLGEDIRKQLPAETALFDSVNSLWKTTMAELSKTKSVLKGTIRDRLLDDLNTMNSKLESIQKSLDLYLETKRQSFPRFYFLSNDDLLEMLGQSKNPQAIQTHLKKCFDNIKTLELVMAGQDGRRNNEAIGMHSSDGEYVVFQNPVLVEGPVEMWLLEIEAMMRTTLRRLLLQCLHGLRKTKRDKWIKDWAGQLLITASQITWTNDCVKTLATMKERQDRHALRQQKKKQISFLNKLSDMVKTPLSKLQRNKIIALITIEIHSRDVIDKMIKAGVNDVHAFEWLSQMRFYWDRDNDDCIVSQTNATSKYGYEYLGNSGRLVITPLTDRCYMTLTTALHLHRGGSPQGPAGTGKTETVKDLGKALGTYVIVQNCSEGLDYKSMGRMFSGLAQTGAWACFDEFNRINIEVLSVVAQQVSSIVHALQMHLNRFVFEGHEIRLVSTVGMFITMNPGYAGRTELPDNLKSMFRPVAMMVPDSAMIAEIILFGQGFSNTKALAKKVDSLYKLASQQLSRQDHYDFGLRALVAILAAAGSKRRDASADVADEVILLSAMNDMNMPKLTAQDVPLFRGIVSDLFPGVEVPVTDYGSFRTHTESEIRESGLQLTEFIIAKVAQLWETKKTRHSVMVVGDTGSGKTTCWKSLMGTMIRMYKAEEKDFSGQPFHNVKVFPINPKAVSLGELYGEFNIQTNEWTDGVLSSVMRTACADERPDEKWLILDGPVDTLWIESMNSVMDSNKILTLINGERIAMPDLVSLLFEVDDLSVASPATISRCGMVYLDSAEMGWQPYAASWLDRQPEMCRETLQQFIDKYVQRMLDLRRTQCNETFRTTDVNAVTSLCRLFDALVTEENGINFSDGLTQDLVRVLELWFVFSSIWSIGASVDEAGRKTMDALVREIDGQFPSRDSVFEYYVDIKKRQWSLWEDHLSASWRYPPNAPFYKIVVPTVDTVRYDFLVRTLISAKVPVLVVGPVGTGKTAVAQSVMQGQDAERVNTMVVNMSAQTSSEVVQNIIESRVEKRTKDVYVPTGGKLLLCFLDDLNMPAKDTYGSQPPLELLKHWVDYGFWYDRQKQSVKYIKDMYLLAAMGPPGGGRTQISSRFQSRFNLINMTFPTDQQITRIFGTMIIQKLQDFEEDIKPLAEKMTASTINIYQTIVSTMLPTPAKIHYLFNLRDISKVFQGLLRAHRDFHDTKEAMLRLWIHECFRVFSDRLVDDKDKHIFQELMSSQLSVVLGTSLEQICPNGSPIFGDFMRTDSDLAVYESIDDLEKLRNYVELRLEDYNMEPGFIAMDLVPFRDALQHMCRVIRVVRQPRGNSFLIGVGGSGRQSLTRLAAFIMEYTVFQIEITKLYGANEWATDLRSLYWMAGVSCKPTIFLFSDTQIVLETFVEDINNILSSGEVPNLYAPEEFEEVRQALEQDIRRDGILETTDSIMSYFIDRVRTNLHIVLCMSPVGEPFKNRVRMYPSLVNCATIDWFSAWPSEALMDVAKKYLENVDLGDPNDKEKLLRIFSTVPKSVAVVSQKMLFEVKRHNYVTPTNYLELVAGYKDLISEKRKDVGDAASKLANGLSKLDDTRSKVETMSIELEETKKKVAVYQKDCEEYLVVIVQQKREADEQQKAVSARSDKIAVEELECRTMAEAAQSDLDEAVPALEGAMKALESLNKKDITEIRSYGKPPALVETVMHAVMVLRKAEPTWAEAKRQLADPLFIKQLMNYDKDNMTDKVLQKIYKYCEHPDFQPDIIGRVSLAAKSLCMWVRAMEVYGRVYRVVAPKKEKLASATSVLNEKQKTLSDARAKLQEVTEKMEELKTQYDEKLRIRDQLRSQSEETELKLSRASQLVTGLAGERSRWEVSIGVCHEQLSFLPGDCLIAAAFLSYCGPFTTNYRHQLVEETWLTEAKRLGVPCNPNFTFGDFLAKPTDVRHWNMKGLPSDAFSTENGIVVTRGTRWPLMVDPQGQAIKWIKNMEEERGLKIIDLQQHDYLRTLENAIQFGTPVLLQNILEELDPSLAPVLNKSVIKQGGRLIMRLGDKEIEYSPEFRFYLTTKLANPHYTPEISTKASIVNFAVKEQGLEAQLLGIVVRKEKPELEEQKDALVVNISAAKKQLVDLEDEILMLLSTAQGSLLDNEKLINTLQSSKVTSEEIAEQLTTSEQTEAKIDAAREGYRPCAQRAAILFFVLNDIGRVDPMYQFSLDAYIKLFESSIDKSLKSHDLAERLENLNNHHTYSVYRMTCRGLFEKHKLLFAFQMCAKILEAAGKLPIEEYNFFLRGGVVLDREEQPENPCPSWIVPTAWDNITELDSLSNFTGLAASFEQYTSDWSDWFHSAEPETFTLAGEWDNKCNELQRMLIVRSLRADRLVFMATTFIINNLGPKFVEPPPLDMVEVVEDSTARTPLIFVLSPGEDPHHALNSLVKSRNMLDRFHHLSLGQGQAPIATNMVRDGVQRGHWVFLANCHLSISWMPELDKIVEEFQNGKPNPNFRLWLSSSPHPDFPISILQSGIKMTTEPPKGLKANMARLYQSLSDVRFTRCSKPEKYKKLLVGLCFFHSVLIERRKFMTLGWNVPYDFNDSDFEVCENLLQLYLDDYEETPWEALKYLISEANYGGRVTDDWDRRILSTYINDYFCEGALNTPNYRLSNLASYYIPDDGDLQSYKDYVHSLPNIDRPEGFGQHPNADIASQIRETRAILDTLLSLQPQVSTSGGASREDIVLELAADILRRLPDPIDESAARKLAQEEPCPLHVVLLQEMDTYNALLRVIRNSLMELEKGVKGFVVMSSDLEETFNCIFDATVPPLWSKAYPSLKPLAAWTRDLEQRILQFSTWALEGRQPPMLWMSGFSFPTGFLTAVLQTSARQNAVSIDLLSWEFHVLPMENTTEGPDEGVYICGLFLEGAGWDRKNNTLVEPRPMELVTSMPLIHFKPAEMRKKSSKGVYNCPCYYYPIRASIPGIIPSFCIAVDLKSGSANADHYIKRGTALLLSLDS